jgi:hypothetical protein
MAAGVDLDEPLVIGRVANRGGCCNTPGERAGSLLRVGCETAISSVAQRPSVAMSSR